LVKSVRVGTKLPAARTSERKCARAGTHGPVTTQSRHWIATLVAQRVNQAPALGDVLYKSKRRLSSLLGACSLALSVLKRAKHLMRGPQLVKSVRVGTKLQAARSLRAQGPLQCPQPNRKIRTQRQHDEMGGTLNGDCPKRDAPQLHDRCDLICPDLPKVL
jgi:hypothetical protein